MMGALGLLAGIVAKNSTSSPPFKSFLIMPLTFFIGRVLFHQQPAEFWRNLSHLNPVFYMIDGFRYGFSA